MLYLKISIIRRLAAIVALFISLPAFAQDTSATDNRQSTTYADTPYLRSEIVNQGEVCLLVGSKVKKITLAEYLGSGNEHSRTKRQRTWLVAGAHAALWGGSYLALNKAWYADYPKESFHFFNDNKEWLQMDKMGHVWTANQMSRVSAELWRWAGLSDKQSTWLGGISGVAYQSIIEIQDGFSAEWGFSWGDMAANIAGSAMYVAQELGWKEQRIQIKLSYWPYDYSSPELTTRRNELFGKSIQERVLKDYNSQTYWLSANIHSFLPDSKMPRWLNLAVGYSANGMLGGMSNSWVDKEGFTHDRSDVPRTRHFFLSPDIDLTKIKTKSKFLRSALFVLNMIKIPAPALELNSRGKLKGHVLYF